MENIMRKGEIACNKQFLLFSQCFLRYMALIFHFKCTLKCRLQFVSIWTSLNFWSSGNGLTLANNKILHITKMEAFTDKKIKESLSYNFVCGRMKNILPRTKLYESDSLHLHCSKWNAGFQNFLLFAPQFFSKASILCIT